MTFVFSVFIYDVLKLSEFCKISHQNAGNSISETLDLKLSGGVPIKTFLASSALASSAQWLSPFERPACVPDERKVAPENKTLKFL